jgi:hypothetical protein
MKLLNLSYTGDNMDKSVIKNCFGPRRYQAWIKDENGKKVPTLSKRSPLQQIEKMESMSVKALKRYRTMFTEHLIVADLVVLQRLGAL